ncbi:MAG: Gfo/Idh/MocA family oxidoreductase [Algoriphagus sp.]|jgi:UDP-N-acetyl-2-amino-2-deoxyglucuronate dehydrogenase|uniref:Gfo/Idh/MocA family protein n=1 Tax=Algoriphagus sp. TaxID=1872435 RepID=UPI002638FD25|nr:Gfo/Idh/MocA family oxidoreductase [Algoriphagus sp.]MDG1279349.1 Gfo/Idh/MocA family oxidoreductase [Algoriphagus sp.]
MKKVGIIGTGAIAGIHAAAIKSINNAELVAVCSSTPDRAQEAEARFGVKGYSDITTFLAHPDLEVVCICTASGRHLEPALAAAKAGKHLIIEKPIEVTLDRADQLINACQTQGVKLAIIFQNRFSSDYKKLKSSVDTGLFGRLLMGNAYVNWFRNKEYYSKSDWKGTIEEDGGGAFINQGIHTIDLLLDLMGEVSEVFGKVQTAYHQIEGEDLGAALVTFKSGAIGNITSATALYPGLPERIEIFGSEGSAILEGGKITHWKIKGEESKLEESQIFSSSGAADPMAISGILHQKQWEEFILSLETGDDYAVDGPTSRKSLELIRGIYSSSKKKATVKFPFKE